MWSLATYPFTLRIPFNSFFDDVNKEESKIITHKKKQMQGLIFLGHFDRE